MPEVDSMNAVAALKEFKIACEKAIKKLKPTCPEVVELIDQTCARVGQEIELLTGSVAK